MIRLIISMNDPCMHFEFNEAWILHGSGQYKYESQNTGKIQNTKVYTEYYPDGSIKLEYSGGTADDGKFLLDGIESWYYPDGNIQRKSIYRLGKKTGTEEYYSEDCKKLWCWEYFDAAASVCKTFHSSGKIKSIVN